MFFGYTTKDERDATELRAEIARLLHVISKGSEAFYRQKKVLDWLEAQDAIFTPETCWSSGGETLQDRIESLIALEEIEMAREGRR